MTVVEAPERRASGLRATASDPAWNRTALAGTVLIASLAVAQAGASVAVALALAAVGTLLAGAVLGPPALRAIHGSPALLIAAGLAAAAVAWIAFLVLAAGERYIDATLTLFYVRPVLGEVLVPTVVVLAAVGGFVLFADALRSHLGLAGTRRSPWRRLTGVGATEHRPVPWGLLAGVALVGLAAVLAIALGSVWVGSSAGLQLLVLLAVAFGVAVVVGTPLLIGGLARAENTQAGGALEEERLRVAAHLHDSVLQTLALVQRQADDPAAVARLARRQEHDLRAWMAGDTDLRGDTLAGALRDAVAEVEDERGLSVEVSVLGDRPLDRGGEALVAAVREALRNAARHAPVSPVFVFCEISADRVEAFVRDEGPGFVLGAVPRERRGVRDAIVGRMAAVGGQASVESVVGEGTEVVLRIGAPR